MNPIFVNREKLLIYRERELDKRELSFYFSSHKQGIIFIEDSCGKLIGYINDRSFKNSLCDCKRSINHFEQTVLKNNLPHIELAGLFISAVDANAIPVMENDKMIGAILKTYPEELCSFDRLMNRIALNVLPVFKKEFLTYLIEKGYVEVAIIGQMDSCQKLMGLIGPPISIKNEISDSTKLIIDLDYSKSYRSSLLKMGGQCDIISLSELLSLAIIPVVINYLNSSKVPLFVWEGPEIERLTNHKSHCALPHDFHGNLESDLRYEDSIAKFSVGNVKVENYLSSNEQVLNENYVVTNGINLIMAISNRGSDITDAPKIHLYGPCLTYGALTPKDESIASYLSRNAKPLGYEVINNGVKNGHSILNDFLYILSTSFQTGDVAVILNAFTPTLREEIKAYITLESLSENFNNCDDAPWYYLDNTFHVNHIANKIIADSIYRRIKSRLESSSYEKASSSKISFFEDGRKRTMIDSENIFEDGLLGNYKEYLLSNKHRDSEGKIIGSVLMTANPITKGHEHLIRYAKQRCDILYVFIVEENLFFFNTVERMMLAKSVINDPNIIILTTGNLMTARFTFPEYFSKDTFNHQINQNDIPDLHCIVFGKVVSRVLNITKRFVGYEEPGSVTDSYNKKLLELMPLYGIEVCVIPRLNSRRGTIISSSIVRKMIEKGDFESLEDLVSHPVETYIRKKWQKD